MNAVSNFPGSLALSSLMSEKTVAPKGPLLSVDLQEASWSTSRKQKTALPCKPETEGQQGMFMNPLRKTCHLTTLWTLLWRVQGNQKKMIWVSRKSDGKREIPFIKVNSIPEMCKKSLGIKRRTSKDRTDWRWHITQTLKDRWQLQTEIPVGEC